jgi:hypothetical protein
MPCGIGGSYRGVAKIQAFQDVTLATGCAVPNILKIMVPSPSMVCGPLLLDLEDKGSTILQHIRNHTSSDTVSHPRTPGSSVADTAESC